MVPFHFRCLGDSATRLSCETPVFQQCFVDQKQVNLTINQHESEEIMSEFSFLDELSLLTVTSYISKCVEDVITMTIK